MKQSKLNIRARAGGISVLSGRLYCSAVPTSAKQVELRARYEAALSLLDQLPDTASLQNNRPVNESVAALAQ